MFESFIGVNFWTALFTLLNFLVLFFVAKKFLFVPVKNMIDSRQKEIDTMYLEAESAREHAQSMEEEYRQNLASARETGETIVKEATVRAKNREEEILLDANRQAEAIRQKAQVDIARQKAQAINDAKDEISSLAMAIAGKVVGRSLNDDDQERLVDSFLAELGDGV